MHIKIKLIQDGNGQFRHMKKSNEIEFTEDLAIQMGERFAKAIVPNSDIIEDNPVKFYDEND